MQIPLLKMQTYIFIYISVENRDICMSIRDICISNTDVWISIKDISYYIKYRYLYSLLETSVFEMQISALNRFKLKWNAI